MKLFDTHAHYTDSRFASEYEGGAEKLLPELFASGVEGIIGASVNAENAREVIELAARYEKMYAAVGVHPTDSRDCESIDSELEQIEELLKRVSFFKETMQSTLILIGLFTLIDLLGIYFLIVGWTFLGLTMIIIFTLMIGILIAGYSHLNKILNFIKKKKVTVGKFTCEGSFEQDEKSAWWKKVQIDGYKIDYLAIEKNHLPQKGDELHIIIIGNRLNCIFATEPIL
jgi:hypothetical protein